MFFFHSLVPLVNSPTHHSPLTLTDPTSLSLSLSASTSLPLSRPRFLAPQSAATKAKLAALPHLLNLHEDERMTMILTFFFESPRTRVCRPEAQVCVADRVIDSMVDDGMRGRIP